jgi:signal transduction histidine kinase
MKKILHIMQEKVNETPIKIFGIFGVINYPFFYFFWKIFPDARYDDLYFRLISTILCIGLILKDGWPTKLKPYLPIYWYITIIFSLPFMGTYVFLANHASSSWMLNSTLGVFLMLIVLDWKSFSIVFPVGIISAALFYLFLNNEIHIIMGNFLSTILNIGWVLIVAILFSRKKVLLENERRETLKSMAAAIAHELRTPLANVSMCGQIIKKSSEKLRNLIVSQKEASANKELGVLDETANDLVSISRGSQNLINLLLSNLKQELENVPQTVLSMKATIEHALSEFVFKPHQVNKVHLDIQSDFQFQGNRDLMTHVFFNLLKNSLYFIQAAGKGEIFITVKSDSDYNFVIFKDTGTGIDKDQLPYLFKPFYSNRPHGTGIGLSFCKRAVEGMNGTINVDAQVGEYTTFTMKFPKVVGHT